VPGLRGVAGDPPTVGIAVGPCDIEISEVALLASLKAFKTKGFFCDDYPFDYQRLS
jgi:hypothetical protein